MSRFNLLTAVVVSLFAWGGAHAADVAPPDEWVTRMGVDFCGQAVGEKPAKVAEIAATITGLALQDAGTLSGFDASFRNELTGSLRIDKPVKLQMGSLVRDAPTLNFVFIREDAEACFALVNDTRESARMVNERMTRIDSPWQPVQSPNPAATVWKRPGRGGDVLMIVSQREDSTEIVVSTEKRARVIVYTDLLKFSEATAKPCVAGALSSIRPGLKDFGSYYEAGTGKDASNLFANPPFEDIGLMFSDQHGGCIFVVAGGGRRFNAMQYAKAMGEAFAAIGGKGISEVKVSQGDGIVAQAWHFTDAATRKGVRYTITAYGGGMTSLEIAPE